MASSLPRTRSRGVLLILYIYSASRCRAVGSIRPSARDNGVLRLSGPRGADHRYVPYSFGGSGPLWALD
eukprot:15469289-Heterocapsa_arctica.AAC.1